MLQILLQFFLQLSLCQDLNFEFDIEEWVENGLKNSYGKDTGNGSFDGMIGALQRNEYDIGVQVGKCLYVCKHIVNGRISLIHINVFPVISATGAFEIVIEHFYFQPAVSALSFTHSLTISCKTQSFDNFPLIQRSKKQNILMHCMLAVPVFFFLFFSFLKT